jgi:hypothetical protein
VSGPHNYEATHGTQEEQAARQASAGRSESPDGPWRLVRWATEGSFRRIFLPNSVRSTLREVERLRDEEFARTGIVWYIEQMEVKNGN